MQVVSNNSAAAPERPYYLPNANEVEVFRAAFSEVQCSSTLTMMAARGLMGAWDGKLVETPASCAAVGILKSAAAR